VDFLLVKKNPRQPIRPAGILLLYTNPFLSVLDCHCAASNNQQNEQNEDYTNTGKHTAAVSATGFCFPSVCHVYPTPFIQAIFINLIKKRNFSSAFRRGRAAHFRDELV
jgi:hypothetical protein